MLVEREQELGLLAELFEQAQARRGNLALVLGEAGIGKTSLINTFIASCEAEATIAWGMCDALFTPRPLGPVYDIARVLSTELAQLADARETGDAVFPAFLATLQKSKRPQLLVIEDIHWADNGTLDFIRFLGRRLAALPVLMIASFRDDEIAADHPIHLVLGDLPARTTHRIKPPPLSLAGIERLNRHSSIRAEEILSVTAGNPFFVTELVASSDADVNAAPSSVKEAVNARLARIGPSERRFLEFVSSIPGTIDTSLLDPIFDGEAEMLALACIGRGLLRRDGDGALRFRHELARLATASRVPAIEARSNHETILKVLLEQHASPIDQIVHHAAGALDGKSVLAYAPKAATAAAMVGSHREAASHLATALEFVSEAEPELAAQLYEDWAYEAGIALRIDEEVIEARRHAITLWRALGRKDKVGGNLRRLSRLHWYRGEAAKAAQLSDEAVRILENEGPSEEKAMAYSMRSQLHMLNDRMEQAIKWGEKALDEASTFNSQEVRVHALNNIGTAKLLRGNQDGLADMDESLSLAKACGLHEDAARVYTNLSEYAVEFKDFDLAERVLSEGIAFDTEHDLDSWTYYLVGRQAQLRLEQGRLRDAETISMGVLDRPGQTLLMRLPSKIVLAKASVRLGRKDANARLTDALQDALATAELQYIVPTRIALIESAALSGDASSALEHFEQLVSVPVEAAKPWQWSELWYWAEKCDLILPKSHTPSLQAPFRCLFENQSAEAAEQFSALGMLFFEACSYLDADTEDSIRSAHKHFMEMSATPMQDRARAIAIERGFAAQLARPSRGPYEASRSHPLGLTRREQDVLAELAKGASNQEIADTLSRSKRTVENHVSAVLRKLNATSRTEVILRIQSEPWLLPVRVD